MDQITNLQLQKWWNKVISINKFILVGGIFICWIAFIDRNSLIGRFDVINEYNQLQKDKEYYLAKIKKDSTQLKELKTNKEILEKFAREQYYLKKDNEDVFVVIETEDKN